MVISLGFYLSYFCYWRLEIAKISCEGEWSGPIGRSGYLMVIGPIGRSGCVRVH